jgi:hypothetical protein
VTNGVKMGPPFKLTEHQADGSREVLVRLRAISTSVTIRLPGCGEALMRAALMMLVCDFPFPGSLKAAQ